MQNRMVALYLPMKDELFLQALKETKTTQLP